MNPDETLQDDSEFERWLAAELTAPMQAEWLEEDVETTPIGATWILQDDGTVAHEDFSWSVPDAGAKERWRVG